MSKSIIIAGFTGTIGSALVKELQKRNRGLFLINRNGIFKKEANCQESVKISNNSCDYATLVEIFKKSKECIYLISSYPQDKELDETIVEEFDVNTHLAAYFAKIAEESKLERFIFVSTSAIFYLLGGLTEIIDENSLCSIPDNFILNKRGSYALSKYLAEKMVAKNISDNHLLTLRLVNIFGREDKETTIIHKFISKIKNGEQLDVYDWSRNFIYLDDLVRVIINILEDEKLRGVVNVFDDKNTIRLFDLASLIKEFFPTSQTKILINREVKEPYLRFKTKNNHLYNFKMTPLKDAIQEIIQYKNHKVSNY